MLEEYVIGNTIDEIESNPSLIVETIYNEELYEGYIITDGIETIICSIDEDNKLIPIINL